MCPGETRLGEHEKFFPAFLLKAHAKLKELILFIFVNVFCTECALFKFSEIRLIQ